MAFTVEQIGTCGCGKPVTHRIIGHPGNVEYGKACKACAERKATQLDAAKVVPKW